MLELGKPVSRKKISIWGLILSYVSIGLSLVSGIILIPTYLKFISVSHYGYWLAIGEIFAWLVVFDPGIGIAVRQKVAYSFGKKDMDAVGEYSFSVAIVCVGVFCIFSIASYFIFSTLNSILDVDINSIPQFKYALIFGFLGTILNLLSFPLESFNAGLLNIIPTGIAGIVANIIRLVSVIILLHLNYGLISIGFGIFIYGLLRLVSNCLILLLFLFKKRIRPKFSTQNLKELFAMSGFSLIGGLSNTVLLSTNLFFAVRFLGPEHATLLRVNQAAPELVKQILERPIMAMNPSLSHLDGEGNNARLTSIIFNYLNYLILFIGFFLVGVVCFSEPFISLWVGSKFFFSQNLILVMAVALSLRLWDSTLSNVLYSMGFLKRNYLITFCFAILYVALVLLFVPSYDLFGFFYAAILGELLTLTFYYPYVMSRKIRTSHSMKRTLLSNFLYGIISSLTIYCIYVLVDIEIDSWFKLILAAAFVIPIYFAPAIWLVPFFRKDVRSLFLRYKAG